MKEKSLNAGLNVPATLDIAPHKNHKTQISSFIVCFLLESNKNYTFNWKLLFYGQSRWILIWSIKKMLWRIKAWICLRHFISRLRRITKHKSHLQSSVFCLNKTKITHSTGNDLFYGQSRWNLIWSTNENVMKDKSCDTWHRASEKSQNTNLIFNRLFLAWIKQKLHIQLDISFQWSIQVDFDLKHK